MHIPIIYENSDFVVIDKPAGISVHRGPGVRGETIVDWLVTKYPETKIVGDEPDLRPGIVHRLDKGTSGVMVIARNQQTFEALKQLFKDRAVSKTYLALACGEPKKNSGTIDEAIGRSMANRTKRAIGTRASGARPARTHWKVLERFTRQNFAKQNLGGQGGYTLIEVQPKTGRMHQIRVHLASIGYPIAGDPVYSPRQLLVAGLDRMFLHAWRISFSYPEGHRWNFEAALPDDLQNVLKHLRELRRGKRYAMKQGQQTKRQEE